MATNEQKLVGRHKRLSFMKVEAIKHARMTGFTSLTESKESKEYSRQYVDEETERTDVVGYATGVDYEFDRHTNTPVHSILAEIADEEIVGTDAQVNIVTVDLFEPVGTDANVCKARMRTYSVIPDSSGDGTDALIYSGSLKAAGEITHGSATTDDKWKTCTFTETSQKPVVPGAVK
ncbi:MAG: hypothetical protein RSD97_09685 [Lachnospiraceae bacterium]